MHRDVAVLALLIGLALSGLVAAFALVLRRERARRKRAESQLAALRATRARADHAERLERVILASRVGTWDFDLTDGSLATSRASYSNIWELFGYDSASRPDGFTDRVAILLPDPENRSFLVQAQRFLDGTETDWASEVKFRHRDGRDRWVASRGIVTRDATGRATRFTGSLIDITELKALEAALRESEERFRSTFENAAVGMAVSDADGRFVEVNRRVSEILGYSRDELLGHSFTEFGLPDERPVEIERHRAFVRGDLPSFTRDKQYLRKDGSVLWASISASALRRDPDGKPINVLAVVQDISERKRLEEDVRRTKELLELGLRNSEVSVFAIEMPDGTLSNARHTLVNFWEPLGYDPADAPTSFSAASALTVAEEAGEQQRRELQEFLDGSGIRYSSERPMRHKDGTVRWRLSRGAAIRDASGMAIRFIGSQVDITEKKHVEERLRESEHRWRSTAEALPQLIWSASGDGTIEYLSAQACDYTGLSEQEMLGDGWANAIHPDDLERTGKSWVAALAAGVPHEVEQRLRRWDGKYRWFTTRAHPVRDEQGRIFKWIASSTDITKLKQLEDNLRRTRDLLELGIRGSKVAIFEFDLPDGTMENARQTMINVWETLGYTATEAPTEFVPGAILAIHPDDLATVQAEIARYLAGGSGDFETEYRVRHKNGQVLWRIARGVAFWGPDGKPTRFLGSFFDITDRKSLEQDLVKARNRLELGVRGSNVGIFEFDMPDGDLASGRQTFINCWETLGYDPGDVPTDFAEVARLLVHPDDHDWVLRRLHSFLASQESQFEVEHRILHRDGSVGWRLFRGTTLRNSEARAIYFSGSMVDITSLKEIEVELLRTREAAETANRAKDEFLANVSHEIRTPMNAILGMTELALDAARSAEQKQLLSTVRSAARNLLGIINDLLDFSKIAAGKLAIDEADFWLRAELGDTLRSLATRAHRKGLELICYAHPEVPDALIGDAGRLRQVLMNLVGNALKFTAQGEVVVEVTTAPSGDDTSVVLVFAIRDTGIGIARAKQASIFRAFEQEDSSTTRRYGGTGLGLTISAQLASLMGGTISVVSEPGKGSTFTFTARFTRSSRSEPRRDPALHELEDLSVLVVDDNETNRRILATWLADWCMRPTSVGDAQSALDALRRGEESGAPYALVLLDGRMPDGDGVTLAGQIVARYGLTKRLILLSSDDSPELASRSRDAGIHAYLLKPVQPPDLLDTISFVMSGVVEPRPASPEPSVLNPRVPAAGLRILVAEDNELNAALLKSLLDKRGYRTQFAADGRAALRWATEAPFDLVLLDLHMPEMDGFEVARALRERERTTGKHLPIVALTARSSSRDRDRCLAAGMDDFLPKPIETDALWAVIDRAVEAFTPELPRRSRLLDARAILRSCGSERDVFDRLCGVFRQTLPDHLERVRSALAARDLRRLAEAAHKLAGTLGAFSAIAGALALTLEDAANSDDLETCRPLVARLDAVCTELLADMQGLTIDDLVL